MVFLLCDKSERAIFMYKRNIYIMYMLSLLQGMVFYAPVATLYRQAQGVTIFQITVIESISLALCMAMELPWGMIADRIGYKKTMLFCNVLYFISKVVFWKADGFGGFLIERIMLSIVCAGLSGVDSSILYLSCEEGESQKVFSVYEGLGTVGLLTTAVVYSMFIGDHYRLAGFLTVFSYGLAMILSFGLLEVKKKEQKRESAKDFVALFKEICRNKQLFLFLLAVALFHEVHQTITVFLSQLQYVRAGISNSMMGILYGLITVVGLSSFLSDRITKKTGEENTIRFCFLFAFLSCAILMVSDRAVLSVLAIVLIRLAFSIFQPLQMELQNRQVMTRDRATALSVNAVFIDSIGIFANILFGALAEYSLMAAFAFGAAACGIGYVLLEIWKKN